MSVSAAFAILAARAVASWRWMAQWPAAYQQIVRGMRAGCFEMVLHDLRAVLRRASGHKEVLPC